MALNNLGLGFLVSAKDAASAVFDAVGEAMSGTEKHAKDMQKTFGELQGEFNSLGLKVAGFGLAGLAGLGVAGKAASDYNAAIAEVASITDRANFPIGVMKEMTQAMAVTYGGDLTGHVKALYQAASSGAQTAAEAQQLLTAANLLAVGGLSDSFAAVDALTNVVNAFGMSLDKTTDIADAMFVAVKVGKTDINQLAHSIGDLAPIANLAGLEMDEMFSAVAAASNQLGSGTKAITGLRAAISSILTPTKDAADEAKRLGITFTREHLGAVGIQQFVEEITHATGYTQDSLSKLFGSIEGLGAIAALTANDGHALADATKAMSERAGAADSAFRTMADATQFAEKRLTANLQVALVKVGEVLLPILEHVLRTANSMLEVFNRAPAILQQVIVGVVGVASVGAVLVGGLLLVAGSIAGIVTVGAEAAAVLAFAAEAFVYLGVVAGIAGLGVAGFRTAIDQDVGGVGSTFQNMYAKVKLAFDALTQLFTDGGFSGAVAQELGTSAGDGVESFVTQVWLVYNRVKSFFDGIVDGFNGAVAAMGPTFAELTGALKGLGRVFGLAQDGPQEASAAFNKFGDVGRTVGAALAGAFELLTKAFTAVVNFGRGVIGGFKAMGPVFDTLFTAVGNLFTAFSKVGTILGAIGGNTASSTSAFEYLGMVVGWVAAGMVNGLTLIINGVTTMVDVVTAYVGGVVGVWQGLIGGFRSGFDVINGILTLDFARAFNGAKGIVYNFAQIVVSVITAMVGTVASLIDSMGRAFGKDLGVRAAVDGASKDIMKDLAGGLGYEATAAGPAAPKGLTVAPGASFAAPSAVGPTVIAAESAGAAAGAADAAAPPALGPIAGLGGPAPIQLTSNIRLEVDGATLASVVAKQTGADQARSYGATPTHT